MKANDLRPWPESIPNVFCQNCCRMYRWFKNPNDANPNRWQAACCGTVAYHEVKATTLSPTEDDKGSRS